MLLFFLFFNYVGGESQGLRLAAAAYLKNFIRRCTDVKQSFFESHTYRNQLAQATLRAEPAVLKVLVDAVSRLYFLSGFFMRVS